ncbi:hypothetical protein AYI69_g6958 [Smittium culicis]|uniref:Uncharacterized protein n=1 Tax=Smittium culicis TaxID=133412 RepID=A0A1R1XV95_9FUNG|nr:hypothetical protein AYI69_g6958 [Smittium culicis]
MDKSTISFVKDLNDNVNLLLSSREPQVQRIHLDEYLTANAPVTNLTPYKELTEALPSIKENLIKSPMSEEKKDAIYNENISITVKKTDAGFYAAQWELAQKNRPIDYYVHELLEKNLGIPVEALRLNFSSSMRIIISDVATLLSQKIVDNIHRTMDLSGKPPQIMGKD